MLIVAIHDSRSRKQSALWRENHGALHGNVRFCDRDVPGRDGIQDSACEVSARGLRPAFQETRLTCHNGE
jgi:hypothetical protein